jgi:hypothetical protein
MSASSEEVKEEKRKNPRPTNFVHLPHRAAMVHHDVHHAVFNAPFSNH